MRNRASLRRANGEGAGLGPAPATAPGVGYGPSVNFPPLMLPILPVSAVHHVRGLPNSIALLPIYLKLRPAWRSFWSAEFCDQCSGWSWALKLSLVILAHNEADGITATLHAFATRLRGE